jgi:hypothetical protein
MVANLNRYLGRPETGWTKGTDGRPQANVGHIGIDAHSPGDGITRYHLYELMEHGGQNNLRNLASLGAGEFYEFLCGVEVGIRLSEEKARSGGAK